jgi:hypothetical protein
MRERSFGEEITAHLELQARNRYLEGTMPIDQYREMFDRGFGGSSRRMLGADDLPTEPETVARPPAQDRSRERWWDTSEERPFPSFDWDE